MPYLAGWWTIAYFWFMLQQKIKELARQMAPEFISIRRHLHAHPELSYQEFETSAFIQQKLTEYNIPFENVSIKFAYNVEALAMWR